eukprot:CAMPEP_0183370446 /NCGR_PEP_ID=MMETSP0164_2-20130417/102446_1 /TAXON_ID=221442 /ORGANISM="Coccolithus pelagicus ssp braarudi, Strain PLY182g" /LENGTH=68 /DNA_ID=CAMNT_0025546845 /DNA_START=503 /DNA_END=705 /DNA_ORIENTATION=+
MAVAFARVAWAWDEAKMVSAGRSIEVGVAEEGVEEAAFLQRGARLVIEIGAACTPCSGAERVRFGAGS